MENVFIDWGAIKPHTVLKEQDKSEVSTQSTLELMVLAPFNAYMEAGCPHYGLYQLITNGCIIYICNPKDVKDLRGKNAKTDKTDAYFIRELWQKEPSAFHKLPIPDCLEIQSRFLMDKYIHFMMDCARFKNRQKSYEKEFGESEAYTEILQILERRKKETLAKVKLLLEKEIEKVKDIKGIGIRYLAGILTVAHPKKFSSLSKYLAYCGYKESSWQEGRGKYNRVAKTLAWQMTKSLIMHKDPKFYPLYLQIKKDITNRHPDFPKARLNGMSMNRISTFLLKELYGRFSY